MLLITKQKFQLSIKNPIGKGTGNCGDLLIYGVSIRAEKFRLYQKKLLVNFALKLFPLGCQKELGEMVL